MTDVRQNFSLIAGDDTDVSYGLTTPEPPIDLTTAGMTWTAYPQVRGVPDKTGAVIVKTKDVGITLTDPSNYEFTVELASADTLTLEGNYYHELVIISDTGRRSTPSIGTMTVIDTGSPINVVAFKSMFPQFENVDDGVVQTALDEAALFVDEDIWVDYVAATFYLAAHFLAAAQASAASGGISGQTITSESIGQISVSYGTSAAASTSSSTSNPSLTTTGYGLMFLQLLKRNSPGIAVV